MNKLEAVIYFAVHAKNLELDGLPLAASFRHGPTDCQPRNKVSDKGIPHLCLT